MEYLLRSRRKTNHAICRKPGGTRYLASLVLLSRVTEEVLKAIRWLLENRKPLREYTTVKSRWSLCEVFYFAVVIGVVTDPFTWAKTHHADQISS